MDNQKLYTPQNTSYVSGYKNVFLKDVKSTVDLCCMIHIQGDDAVLQTVKQGPVVQSIIISLNLLVSGQNVNCSSKYSIKFTGNFAKKM